MLLVQLFACAPSPIPEDALHYNVKVTATADECHPDSTQGYSETFEYIVAFDGSDTTIYIGEEVFAVGQITGCDLTYQTVVLPGENDTDGAFKWQLFGTASVDPTEGDACVEGENDWEGTEYFEIVSSEDEQIEVGCQYTMDSVGGLVAAE